MFGAAVAEVVGAWSYLQWGVKNPSTLFLKVSEKAEIELDSEAVASVAATK